MPRRTLKSISHASEAEIQTAVMAWLAATGSAVIRRNVAGPRKLAGGHYVRLGHKGQADLYGKSPTGAHLEIEVKRPGQRPRPEQVDWLVRMNGSGRDRSAAFWVTSVDDLSQIMCRLEQGWRVVYDHDPLPGDFRLEPP